MDHVLRVLPGVLIYVQWGGGRRSEVAHITHKDKTWFAQGTEAHSSLELDGLHESTCRSSMYTSKLLRKTRFSIFKFLILRSPRLNNFVSSSIAITVSTILESIAASYP